MLAVTAVSVTAKVTNAGGSNQQATQDTVVPCSDPNGADDEANEPEDAADTDNIEEQCGPQDEADDANEADETSGVADTVVPCSDPNGADDDANEAEDAADTDNIEEQCGPQDENGEEDEAGEVDDANEQKVAPGTIDDGADLLPQAAITLEQAITAAQSAAQGALGEVDLEEYKGKLAFNVEVGDNDVKVDAQSGAVLAVEKD
jgi:uncharacterized membrane protein YkoI